MKRACLTIGLMLAASAGCNVERAAQSFGEQFKQWHPIDAETARALGEGIRPQVTVIDEKAAAVLAAGVDRGLTAILAPKEPTGPPPGVPVGRYEAWAGFAGLLLVSLAKWADARRARSNGGKG